jgi:hypothetical protein
VLVLELVLRLIVTVILNVILGPAKPARELDSILHGPAAGRPAQGCGAARLLPGIGTGAAVKIGGRV